MLRGIGRIYFLYAGAMLAVLAAMYYPGLDLLLCLVYLILLALEAREEATWLPHWLQRLVIALIWQLPGFSLILADTLHLQQYWGWVWYAKFTLELWDLPVLPLISLIPAAPSWPTPPYYSALFAIVPLQSLLYLVFQIGVNGNKRNVDYDARPA